ncbi:MAG TPA: CsbD family protein [Pirellulales bacterium]|nr:CsbD family protein [Pirellulales bacterium]
MLNAQEVRGQWDQLRGKIKQKWGQLTDDDLQIVGGNVDELVGRIHEKTGVAREQVEKFIGELASGTSDTVERARESAMNYANQAAGRVRETYEQVSDRMRDGYDEVSGRMRDGYERVGERVRENPGQAMLAVFGMGVITGVVLGLMLRSE